MIRQTFLRSFFCAVLLLPLGASAGAPRVVERQRTYHVLHYALDLTVHDSTKSIEGSSSLRLVPLEPLHAIKVDAADMTVSSVRVIDADGNDHCTGFNLSGEQLIVSTDRLLTNADTVTESISYIATPKTGLFFVVPDSGDPSLPRTVWTQGESEENHHWFPCYDYPNDKATWEIRVTVRESATVVSNGALLNVTHDPARKTRTYSWYSSKPFSSYLASLVVGEYEKIEARYKAIPVQYYVYPGRGEDGARTFANTPAMIRFFSDRLGYDYPWPKYAQTVIPRFTYSGMENVSATTLTDAALRDPRAMLDGSSEGLIAHELAHQWFGDLITCRNWANAWLNEGFATYFQSLYDEQSLGWNQMQGEMIERQAYVMRTDTGTARRPTVCDRFYEPEDVFDGQIYARGACILHMLRYTLGDDVFWKGFRHYVDLHQYGVVVTDDFRRAMEETSGKDLRWFFDEWAFHAGYPELSISTSYDSSRKVVRLDIRQEQKTDSLTPLFTMPVGVEVTTAEGVCDHRVTLAAEPEQEVDLPSSGRPLNIVFNKGGWLLARVRMSKPAGQWLFQLAHGDVAGRAEALKRLAHLIESDTVQEAVGRALTEDPYWGIRRRAAEVLGRAKDPETLKHLAPAFRDSDARVRAAATLALKYHPSIDALVALGNLFASDSSYAVQTAALRSLVAIDPSHALKYCEKGLTMDSYRDSIRAVAITLMGTLKTGEIERRILAMSGAGHMQEVRLAAMSALADNWPTDGAVQTRLLSLLGDPSVQVRRRALEKLGLISGLEALPVVTHVAEHDPNAVLRREARKALERIDQRNGYSEPSSHH